MAFNIIQDGDDGLATPVMENFYWAGRMGLSSFYPMNAAGAYAVQDFGETGKEWGDIYLASGKKIYVGGIEFKGGGGGGGIEPIQLKSNQEKMGAYYGIGSNLYLNESFYNSSNVTLTPRVTYVNGTTLVADINKTDLDLMNATTGWADGAGAGGAATVAQDTTNKIEGTGSVKFSRASQNGVIQMVKTFTAFSVVDTLLTFSFYVDTVSSLTRIFVTLESSAGNSKTYYVPVANFSATTWCHVSIDPTLDTADASAGTFVPSGVTKIYFGSTTSGAQTVTTSVDFVITQPNWTLTLPYSLYIWDGTNQERLAITSVAGTGNHQRRTYTITALSNGYAVGASYAKERNVTIAGGMGVFPTGLAGAVALTVYDQTTKYLSESPTGKTLTMAQRFADLDYKINTLSATTETKITVASDIKAYFKSGDKVILFHKKFNGRKWDSYYNATIGANFKILTLTSDSTYSAPSLTLTHTGDVNTGADTSEWYIVRYSAEMLYLLEANNANGALTTLVPSKFILGGYTSVFSDNFNRADGEPGNGWTRTDEGSGTAAAYFGKIASNILYGTQSGTYSAVGRVTRNLENYIRTGAPYVIRFSGIYGTNFNSSTLMFSLSVGSNGSTGGSGCGMKWGTSATNTLNYIALQKDTAVLASSTAKTFTIGTKYQFELTVRVGSMELRVWDDGQVRPEAATITAITDFSTGGNYLHMSASLNSNTNHNILIDDIDIVRTDGGYITVGSVDNLSGTKFTTATKLTRQDSTNQNPMVFQRDAILT